MTVAPQGRSGTARRTTPGPDVVAGMPRGSMAPAVARAAVAEAVRRGARVRFVQVLKPGSSDQERAGADERTFAVALRALREAPRVRVAFETVEGDAQTVFVERSRQADVLVVAGDTSSADLGGEGRTRLGLAEYCRGHAGCPVLIVDRRPAPRR